MKKDEERNEANKTVWASKSDFESIKHKVIIETRDQNYELWLLSSRNSFISSIQLTERGHLPSTTFEQRGT
jgi:hypothetical protein